MLLDKDIEKTLYEITETHIAGLPSKFSNMNIDTKIRALEVIMLMRINKNLRNLREKITEDIGDLAGTLCNLKGVR